MADSRVPGATEMVSRLYTCPQCGAEQLESHGRPMCRVDGTEMVAVVGQSITARREAIQARRRRG
jgi:hypothetical protein